MAKLFGDTMLALGPLNTEKVINPGAYKASLKPSAIICPDPSLRMVKLLVL